MELALREGNLRDLDFKLEVGFRYDHEAEENMATKLMKFVRHVNISTSRTCAQIVGCLFVCTAAQASLNISALDTGAGLYNANNGSGPNFPAVVDPNWTVSLLSTDPAGHIPPGGIPTGTAYLVANNIGFPFGYWLPNTAASSWITYSTPTQVGGDTTADTFQYQLTFIADNSGLVNVSWLSDNASEMYISGGNYSDSLVGSKLGPGYSTFDVWNAPISLCITDGNTYTIDLDVYNAPQSYGNPTGANVEFTGDVCVTGGLGVIPSVSASPVPEPGTLIAGALLLLPIGASTLRIMRGKPAS